MKYQSKIYSLSYKQFNFALNEAKWNLINFILHL